MQIVVLALLLVLGLVALYHGKGNGGLTLRPLYAPELFHAKSIFAATSICVMSFLGFDAISTLSEEVKSDDQRLVGRAIVSVLLLAAALLAVTAWILGDLLSGFAIKDPAAATYEVADWAIGPWAAALTAWVMATVVGVTNALPMQVGVARVMYAMGRDRQLPAVLAKIHPRHGTPYVGMVATSVISVTVALVMRNQMDEFVSIVNFGALCGFLLSACIGHRKVLGQRALGTMDRAPGDPGGRNHRRAGCTCRNESAGPKLGLGWLAAGLVYGAVLMNSRRRAELAI